MMENSPKRRFRYLRSLRGWFAALFLVLFALMLLLGFAGLWGLSHANKVSTDLRARWLPNVRLLGDLNNYTSDYRTAEANSLLAANPTDLDSSLQEMRQLDQTVTRAQRDYEQIPHGPDEAALYQGFSDTWARYKAIADEVTTLRVQGNTAEAAAMYRGRSRTTYDEASDLLGKLTELNVELADRASSRSAASYVQASSLMGGSLGLVGFMLFIVVVQFRRRVSNPLLELGEAMLRLAVNDTRVRIGHTSRSDEIGEMARAAVVFRDNALELIHSQQGLAQQATMLEEKLALEQSITVMQRNFVSMITHEFRTPLTQIDGQAQRLNNRRKTLRPDDIAERSGKIRVAVARIIRMIDQLVETTRLLEIDPRMFYHPEPIDLAKVLRDVCRQHHEVSPAAFILEDFQAPRLPMTGDPKLLFQAFSNLVANAIKYSTSDPRVVVRARPENGSVVVSVRDSGIGIPETDLPNVFTRYYRGGNVSGFVGTGVGLFLVATVIRLHGGDVGVESTVGNGSVFTVTLPVAGIAGSNS